jgi:hypothetical protein
MLLVPLKRYSAIRGVPDLTMTITGFGGGFIVGRRNQFGLPEQRKYPMPDASHARNAKSRF